MIEHSKSRIEPAPTNATARGGVSAGAENLGVAGVDPIQTISYPDRSSITAAKQTRAWGINE
jgi:hypothetical protein